MVQNIGVVCWADSVAERFKWSEWRDVPRLTHRWRAHTCVGLPIRLIAIRRDRCLHLAAFSLWSSTECPPSVSATKVSSPSYRSSHGVCRRVLAAIACGNLLLFRPEAVSRAAAGEQHEHTGRQISFNMELCGFGSRLNDREPNTSSFWYRQR